MDLYNDFEIKTIENETKVKIKAIENEGNCYYAIMYENQGVPFYIKMTVYNEETKIQMLIKEIVEEKLYYESKKNKKFKAEHSRYIYSKMDILTRLQYSHKKYSKTYKSVGSNYVTGHLTGWLYGYTSGKKDITFGEVYEQSIKNYMLDMQRSV